MGSCKDLKKWPEEVLKVLHVAFCGLTILLLLAAATVLVPPDPFPNYIKHGSSFVGLANDDKLDFVAVVQFHWSSCGWFLLTAIPLIGGIVVLILFINGDPRKRKDLLLKYYVICSVLMCIGMILSIVYFIRINLFFYCQKIRSGGTRDVNALGCNIAETGFFWVVFFAVIFTIGGFASYVASAVYNEIYGYP